jgi:hypothetical protein
MTQDPFDITLAPLKEPATLIKGVFTQWRRAITLPPTDYSIRYSASALAGNHTFVVAGILTGDEAQFTLLNAASAAWHVGEYRWSLQLVRTSDSQVLELATGVWRVFSNTDDRRTHAEVMLAKIESLLEGRADNDVASYSINGRSLDRIPLKEMIEWRDYYRAEVVASGGSVTVSGPSRSKLLISFKD